MKKLELFICFFFLSGRLLFAQYTVTLTTGNPGYQDAVIRDLSPTMNYGTHPEIVAHGWTNSGEDVVLRSLFQFDLSGIHQGSTIQSAVLSLYFNPNSPSAPAGHSNTTNSAWLKRITEPWDQSTVTWATQPATTSVNEVTIPASTDSSQDYPSIDVTQLIQSMVDDPTTGYGFLFEVKNETPFHRLVFASGDNPDSTLHPKLTIVYDAPTSVRAIDNQSNALILYPNPNNGVVNIKITNPNLQDLIMKVYNNSGKVVFQKSIVDLSSPIQINNSNLPKGNYFIEVSNQTIIMTKEFLIE